MVKPDFGQAPVSVVSLPSLDYTALIPLSLQKHNQYAAVKKE